MSFQRKRTVRIHEVDAAGVLFFANYFRFAHDLYEEFLETGGIGLGRILNERSLLIPIRNAESHYRASLKTGEELLMLLRCEKISTHSFRLGYEFLVSHRSAATLATVHVCVSAENPSRLVPVPDWLRSLLEEIVPKEEPEKGRD